MLWETRHDWENAVVSKQQINELAVGQEGCRISRGLDVVNYPAQAEWRIGISNTKTKAGLTSIGCGGDSLFDVHTGSAGVSSSETKGRCCRDKAKTKAQHLHPNCPMSIFSKGWASKAAGLRWRAEVVVCQVTAPAVALLRAIKAVIR
jgi:hypothetical protein